MKTTPTSMKQSEEKARIIKLGVDVHKKHYTVVRQIDELAPQSAQKFSPERFLAWAAKQLADRVVSCYEAGCFGYVLHRTLTDLGIENYVVRPRDWDEYGRSNKTDKRDARQLCCNLDRYLSGNTQALCVIRVPTQEEEQQRSLSRQRETLANERKRLQNWGTSMCRYYGKEIGPNWWKPKDFEALKENLPDYLINLLAPMQRVICAIDEELKKATAREERTCARELPVGLGALTASVLDKEFVNYNRFNNRRQVSSFTGLVPGEDSSGNRRIQGSINKHGNPRVRHMLIEAIWRMVQFQPDYKPFIRWKERLVQGSTLSSARKKKAAVAMAREFAVDWWRLQTRRATAEELGLKMGLPSAASLKPWSNQQRQGQSAA